MLPSITVPENDKVGASGASSASATAVTTAPPNPKTSVPSGTNANGAKLGAPIVMSAAQKAVDFINFYDVLQMPMGSDPTQLRKRISEMYLDAQKNQDHRNQQKKVYYQQLYEVYLPQARHLLLDTKRRAEYDGYLEVYREDQERSAEVEEVMAAQSNTAAPQNPAAPKVIAKAIEELMTPEELTAYRADLWRQWEDGLERSKGELAKLTFSPIELQQRAVDRRAYMTRVMTEVLEENRKMEEKRERERRREQEAREAEQAKAREEEFQRRREQNFDENIDNIVTTAKLYGVAGACVASLLVCFSLTYVINIHNWMQGLRDTLNYALVGISIVISAIAAWKGAQFCSQRVEARSVSRKDVQKEAELLARKIMDEKLHFSTRKGGSHLSSKEADEMHQEVNNQAKRLHQNAFNEILVENAGYGRAFIMTDASLLFGFVVLYVVNTLLTHDRDLSLRPTVAVFIWIVTMAISAAIGFFSLQRVRTKTLKNLGHKAL